MRWHRPWSKCTTRPPLGNPVKMILPNFIEIHRVVSAESCSQSHRQTDRQAGPKMLIHYSGSTSGTRQTTEDARTLKFGTTDHFPVTYEPISGTLSDLLPVARQTTSGTLSRPLPVTSDHFRSRPTKLRSRVEFQLLTGMYPTTTVTTFCFAVIRRIFSGTPIRQIRSR